MIRPLRRRHAVLSVALAVALPSMFVMALGARPDEAAVLGDVPPAFLAGPDGARPVTPDSPALAGRPVSGMRLPRGMGTVAGTRVSPEGTWLDLDVGDLPAEPGLLAYWVPDAAPTDFLPPGAVLLGALRPRSLCSYPLPTDALRGQGALLLYSLGHQAVVGVPTALDAEVLGTVGNGLAHDRERAGSAGR